MQTLLPTDSTRKIKVRDDGEWSEFEVQAGLFTTLKANGFDVRGEVPWRDKDMHCRFDIVMFENGEPVHIIEVKNKKIKHKTCLEDTRQGRRYRLFGVPVTFIYGAKDAEDFFVMQLKRKG